MTAECRRGQRIGDLDDLLASLNPAQLAAVTAEPGVTLVLAGAGSGKTRVIAARVAWHLEKGADPHAVAAVTFTNRAAREMAERVAGLVAELPFVGTFHRFGLGVLRRHGHRLGLGRRPEIVGRADQVGILREAMRDLGLQPSAWDLSDAMRLVLEGRTSLALEGRVRFRRPHGLAPMGADLVRRFEQGLRDLGAVDFDDLILLPLRLLRTHPDAAAQIRARTRFLLVDEFQDTNHAQMALVRALVEEDGALTAVGDDDQSIYGFRGARVENVLEFERAFPGCRVVRLEKNYRSAEVVLDLANRVIRQSAARTGKTLRAVRSDPGSVGLYGLQGPEAEAAFVAAQIRRAVARGVDPAEIAVLYRANRQAAAFEEALAAEAIPFRRIGGTSLLDRKEIRDALAWLALLLDRDDDRAFRRALQAPPRGVGAVALSRLDAEARRRGCSLYEAAEGLYTDGPLQAAAQAGLRSCIEAMRAAQTARRLEGAAAAYRGLLEGVDFRRHLFALADGPAEGSRRQRRLQALVRILERFEERDRVSGARDFLDEVVLNAPSDLQGDEDPEGGRPAQVTLMTLHAAKGLEFDVVFLCGVEEGLLPHERSQSTTAGIAEERRLLYVGITRARRHLILTYARSREPRGPTGERRVSRFLRDVGLRPRLTSPEGAAAAAPAGARSGGPDLSGLRALLAGDRDAGGRSEPGGAR